MGKYANKPWPRLLLFGIAGIVALLNVMLFVDMIRG